MPTTDIPKPAKLGDPKAHQPHNHPNSQPRGGFIVHRRVSNRGDLIGRVRPTEHASLESAVAEATRLAVLHEREFAVFQEVFAAPAVVAAALPEIARRFAMPAPAPLTHIIRFTIPWKGSAPEDVLAETPVGDAAASVVEYLGTGGLNHYILTAVYAADLTDGAERLINVTAAILRDVAAYVEAAAIELPRSLEDAFTRHGIPQPMAWVEANRLAYSEFESERLGPVDCLDRRRAA